MIGPCIVRIPNGKSTPLPAVSRYNRAMDGSTRILAFYAFKQLSADAAADLRSTLSAFGTARGMRGLVLLATEGINGTVCGSPEAAGEWKSLIDGLFPDATWNESAAGELVFPRWLVKIREEIVALDRPDSSPLDGTHLTPAEWNAMMERGDAVVIDTRNAYETKIGMFEGAIDPSIQTFQEFPAYAAVCDVPKDKNVMLYCTGGIRCEKAVAAMKDAGYPHVFQLKGGILSYLKEFPDAKFNGECFVFDHRVAVDQRLRPSATYKLCPSCGDPGTEHETCGYCAKPFTMCSTCLANGASVTCCKNCRYHFTRLTVSNADAVDAA